MKIFDFGQEATGIIAIGQVASGFFALGQMATGVIAIGQVSRGFFAVGQGAIGFIAIGQGAVGVFYTIGMLGIGGYKGQGMLVLSMIPEFKYNREKLLLAIMQFLGWFIVCGVVWFVVGNPVLQLFFSG